MFQVIKLVLIFDKDSLSKHNAGVHLLKEKSYPTLPGTT